MELVGLVKKRGTGSMFEKIWLNEAKAADRAAIQKMNDVLGEVEEPFHASLERASGAIIILYRLRSGSEINEGWIPGFPIGPGYLGITINGKILGLKILEKEYKGLDGDVFHFEEPIEGMLSRQEIEVLKDGLAFILAPHRKPNNIVILEYPGKGI
ncbi:MAG: hypothetical protein IPO40_10185 [Fibrobacteres bacterium]|nr:hypothetical protein [Fibrobacterota bacterium]